jgi:hypothetical protein
MGCDLKRSEDAAKQTEGVTLIDQMYAGSKLEAETPQAQAAYFRNYDAPFIVDFMVTPAAADLFVNDDEQLETRDGKTRPMTAAERQAGEAR